MLGYKSRGSELGVVAFDGSLKSCGTKPNCVSSRAEKGPFFISPISFSGDPAAALLKLEGILAKMDRLKVEKKEGAYLYVTARSKIFGFVDDVQFHIPAGVSWIEVRSESRVGYSDLGANRKRVEQIRLLFSGS